MIWDTSFCGWGLSGGRIMPRISRDSPLVLRFAIVLLVAAAAIPAEGREKKDVLVYGAGLIVNIPLPEPEVARVVEDLVANTIIRGTKEYNKDEYVTGAVAATSTSVFPAWTEGGKVFYKVRKQVVDPRGFKNSGDVGTLAVRYVVQPQGDNNTVLRLDAAFVEDFRHGVHPSDGSVESSEYKDIQDRLQAAELIKKETEEALREKQERQAKKNFGLGSDTVVLGTPSTNARTESVVGENMPEQTSPSPSSAMPQTSAYDPPVSLEQHVADLRRQVERSVKKPGAPLKSSPFHTASTLKSLEPGTEVLLLITTPYWYGIETHEGEHGWLRRDQLEQAP